VFTEKEKKNFIVHSLLCLESNHNKQIFLLKNMAELNVRNINTIFIDGQFSKEYMVLTVFRGFCIGKCLQNFKHYEHLILLK